MAHYNYTDNELQDIISSSHSWNEVLQKLDMKTMTRSLQRRIQKENINYTNISNYFDGLHTKINKFTKEELENIIRENTNWENVMNKLGYKSCIHVPIIEKKLAKLNIDYKHLILPEDAFSQRRFTLDEILVKDSTYYGGMRILLKRLKKERNWEHVCSICKLSEWNEKPIPLEIDHIDGCHTNNTYENLRAICPNCHAQTDTYKGKNMAICKNNTNKKPVQIKPIEPKPILEDKLCTGCSKIIDRRYTQCNACRIKSVYESGQFRKVERPSYEQLQSDIKEMSMVQVGKKYGVSDNAIRKWLKTYQRYSLTESK